MREFWEILGKYRILEGRPLGSIGLRLLPPVHIKATKSVCNADIPEDWQTYAEVMYDVFTLNKKKKKKKKFSTRSVGLFPFSLVIFSWKATRDIVNFQASPLIKLLYLC